VRAAGATGFFAIMQAEGPTEARKVRAALHGRGGAMLRRAAGRQCFNVAGGSVADGALLQARPSCAPPAPRARRAAWRHRIGCAFACVGSAKR
jgi:hypothetical protein